MYPSLLRDGNIVDLNQTAYKLPFEIFSMCHCENIFNKVTVRMTIHLLNQYSISNECTNSWCLEKRTVAKQGTLLFFLSFFSFSSFVLSFDKVFVVLFSLLYKLKTGQYHEFFQTVGCNTEIIEYQNCRLEIRDVGSHNDVHVEFFHSMAMKIVLLMIYCFVSSFLWN